ncbi:hypothetical protein [Hyphomonas sp.]|uniref:hypothetical protein n=1 Tax=Hyphomonas sp. TaxID=87 RepID=UPI0032EE28F0
MSFSQHTGSDGFINLFNPIDLNGSIGLGSANSKWESSVWGQNLTDEYDWQQITSNANVVLRFAGMPRTYGASLTYRF